MRGYAPARAPLQPSVMSRELLPHTRRLLRTLSPSKSPPNAETYALAQSGTTVLFDFSRPFRERTNDE